MKLQAQYREAGCLHLEHGQLPAELHGNCAPSEGMVGRVGGVWLNPLD